MERLAGQFMDKIWLTILPVKDALSISVVEGGSDIYTQAIDVASTGLDATFQH